MSGSDVRAAVEEMVRVLGPYDGRGWTVPAGTLEWSCWATAAHVAHDLLAYAGQVTGRPDDGYLPFDLRVSPAAGPREVLAVVTACGGLLATAVDAADPAVRAWHYGPCDPGGFAAMGVAETLLHTWDVTSGLGVRWEPPSELSAAVVRRLFPDAPDGPPPAVLRWLTGRGELPGLARRTSWSWRAAVD
ncbi:maleylpyruvate isomerase N-terminal domain-containing protein [Micromonospora sp. WMMD812]|uniref:maleylpyruvate isomerase N-terminal domain-containing protein n=1 Tax=Micromonospora sp. WMMD812 TaxID=3015152 RepID=UPI00248CB9D2|nr:maleylpyruvate isomerase N-terminal domain-containing protein [Micromonospora sp. WMMD812]WBB70862.1 maleylpyruvate isomerase N-terminal domain-containing protein [Micromonospora sp. WMMD812]